MRKTVIAFMTIAAILMAESCQKDNEITGTVSGSMAINAVAKGIDTKAELAYKYDVLWNSDDKILVTDRTAADSFTLVEGAGTTVGTFRQDGSASFSGQVEGFYPSTIVSDGKFLWPAVQTNNQVPPMYSNKTLVGSEIEDFSFSSLGAVLQLVVSTTETGIILDKIELSDAGKALSGAFDITDGKAVIKEGEKCGITLDVYDTEIGVAARYFNIAVPAGKYNALTLRFYTNDERAVTLTSSTMPEILHNTVAKVTLAVNGFSKYAKSISLDKSEISLIAGGHGRVNATLTPSDADNKNIVWSSSDESVAKVIGNGIVIGVAPGAAIITATAVNGGCSAQCEVSVTASAPKPDKTLPGVFSVSESRAVYFTKGNLSNDGQFFYFEEHQYDCPEDSFYSDSDHFFWSMDPHFAIFGKDDHPNDNDILFTNSTAYTPNASFSVDEIEGVFRTLANDEWNYLFGETDQRKGRYACGVTINDGDGDHTGCLVVAPDLCLNSYVFDTEKKYYSASEWTEAENAGLVCLPLTGVRLSDEDGDIIDLSIEKGLYWASNCSDENGAYCLEFNSEDISPVKDTYRTQGKCIRLVADVKE